LRKVIPFPNIRKTVRQKFTDILAEAEREQAQSKAGSVAYAFLIISLLCTVAPYKPLSIFASMAVLPIGTLYFAICYKHPFLFIRKSFATLVALVVLSVASGCSAGFTYNPDQTVLDLCRDEFSDSCRYGVSNGVTLFGIQVQESSIEAAITNGSIEKTYAIDRSWSGGIVSTSEFIVYGG
jgi:hypothetical protein